MVVDYLGPKDKPPALTVGKQYDVDGTFSINSPTGFGASEGLLIFEKMTDDKGSAVHLALGQAGAEGARGRGDRSEPGQEARRRQEAQVAPATRTALARVTTKRKLYTLYTV